MEIEQLIREYVNQNILFSDDGVEYDNDTSFLASGILDSMSVLELVSWMAGTFGVTADIRDITPDNFDSVTRLAAFIRRKKLAVGARNGNGNGGRS